MNIETDESGRKRKASECGEPETRINKRSRTAVHHPPSRAEKIQMNLDEDEWLGVTVIDSAKVSGTYYN